MPLSNKGYSLNANGHLLQLPISHAAEARRAVVMAQKYRNYHKWRVHSGPKKHQCGTVFVARHQGRRMLRFFRQWSIFEILGALFPDLQLLTRWWDCFQFASVTSSSQKRIVSARSKPKFSAKLRTYFRSGAQTNLSRSSPGYKQPIDSLPPVPTLDSFDPQTIWFCVMVSQRRRN